MKALLSRCALRRSIGLVIEERQLAVCILATTPLGRQPVFCHVQACTSEPPEAALEQLLAPWLKTRKGEKRRIGPWAQLGMPEPQVFGAVVPVTDANRNAQPQTYFLEAVQATNLRAEERIIDLIKLDLNKRTIACVAASPRSAISPLVELLEALGIRIGLVEPAPASLFRAGTFHRRAPRGCKLTVRFFLGIQRAIGVLAAGMQPLFWHSFDLPAGDETAAVLAAYSTLWMIGRQGRITLAVDAVIVHGRPDIHLAQDPTGFRERTGAQWIRCEQPDYDTAATAFGLALANPLADLTGHNLGRRFKPTVCMLDIFPWAQLAVHGALVAAVSLFLQGTVLELNARLKSIRTEMGKVAWLKDQNQNKLDSEKKTLQAQSKAIEAFRGTRVNWSAPLRSIAAAAPENTVITGLSGDAEIEALSRTAQAKAKKQLILNFATPMSDDGSMPREIDDFVSAVRAQPTIKRHFPLIEVSGLRANPAKRAGRPFASYSIICLPKTETPKTAAARQPS